MQLLESNKNDYYYNNNSLAELQYAMMNRHDEFGLPEPNKTVQGQIIDRLDEMEVELIIEAFQIAAFAPRPSWAYVAGILRNWHYQGIHTLHEYEVAQFSRIAKNA